LDAVARRHAEFYRDLLERAEAEWEARPTAEWLADYRWRLDNVRAALGWAFSSNGNASIGVRLTAAAVSLWMHLSLMDECHSRAEQALASLSVEPTRDAHREMKLYAAIATSLTYTRGAIPELKAAWTKTLDLAEQLDDIEYQLRAVWQLWAFNRLSAWRRAALTKAGSFCALAANRPDPNHRLVGEWMLGVSQHWLGDQARARRHLEGVLAQYVESDNRSHIIRFQVDLRVSARTFLAPTYWLLGFPDQAMRAAEAAIEEARAINHTFSLCHALVFGSCPAALLMGDMASGERYARTATDHSAGHGLSWRAYGRCYQGALLIKRGEIAAGLRLLRTGFDELHGFATLRFMDFLMPQALCWVGEIAEGLARVDEAIARSEETEEHRLTAGLLHIKGELLLARRARDARGLQRRSTWHGSKPPFPGNCAPRQASPGRSAIRAPPLTLWQSSSRSTTGSRKDSIPPISRPQKR
jgi:predicted ATPase